jgi:hypothetical protein
MAHLHNFAKQTGIIMGNIGQKVKQTAQIAGELKAIYNIGMFLKNAMTAAAPIAAMAAL